MTLQLKFCGIRRPEDVSCCNRIYQEYGLPQYAGFVFAPGRRQVTPEGAAELLSKLNPEIQGVGVFVNAPFEELEKTVKISGVSVVQLHGEEDASYLEQAKTVLPGRRFWKAVRARVPEDVQRAEALPADALLLDAFQPASRPEEYGGTGIPLSRSLLKRIVRPKRPWMLAGGLNSGNIESILDFLAAEEKWPMGVDLSSGIETDGVKSFEKMREIAERLAAYSLKSGGGI